MLPRLVCHRDIRNFSYFHIGMRPLKAPLKRLVPESLLNLTRRLIRFAYLYQQRLFDRRFGVDTGGVVKSSPIDVVEQEHGLGNLYRATPRRIFVRMLRSVQINYNDFTFVDIGSGKGAVLLYASEFPFKRIIGIEYSKQLNHTAEINIGKYPISNMKCKDVTTVCIDALAYSLPPEPLVLFLWNPFKGRMMTRMLANIERSLRERPRALILISYNLDAESLLDEATWLERIRIGWNHTIYRIRLNSDH